MLSRCAANDLNIEHERRKTMTQKTRGSYWQQHQIDQFVRNVRKNLGNAWNLMVDDERRAFLEAAALAVIRMQATDVVAVAAMDELVTRMLEKGGL